jgi:hypothetical protein
VATAARNDGVAEMGSVAKYPAQQFLMPKYLSKLGGDFTAPSVAYSWVLR